MIRRAARRSSRAASSVSVRSPVMFDLIRLTSAGFAGRATPISERPRTPPALPRAWLPRGGGNHVAIAGKARERRPSSSDFLYCRRPLFQSGNRAAVAGCGKPLETAALPGPHDSRVAPSAGNEIVSLNSVMRSADYADFRRFSEGYDGGSTHPKGDCVHRFNSLILCVNLCNLWTAISFSGSVVRRRCAHPGAQSWQPGAFGFRFVRWASPPPSSGQDSGLWASLDCRRRRA